jgi:hypothetical protein
MNIANANVCNANKRSFLLLLLLLWLLTLPAAAQAQFTYTTNNGAITITGYTGPGGDVTIPNTITGLPVTVIGTLALAGSGVTNLTIPESISTIGDAAFHLCTKLVSITIPNSVTSIGYQAFWDCSSLPAIMIPASVTNLGHSPFEFCFSMTEISVDALNPVYSSQGGVLFDKHQSMLIQCPRGKAGSFIIPESVTNLETYAFAFCENLTNITIPNSLTILSDNAFYYCSGLTSIMIPATIKSIEGWVFSFCHALTTVTIPNGVTNIGERAFAFCAGVTNISIPESVTAIGVDAFNYCRNLTAITVDSLNPAYGSLDGVLFDPNRTTLIQCPGGKSGSYSIPQSVVSIGDEAFSWCTSLSSVVIPDSVTHMGSWAFSDCTNLTSVSIGNGLTDIGLAFPECTSLTTVTIGKGVTCIGGQTFWRCYNLTRVYFQGNAPSIGSDVFLYDDFATVYYLPGTTGWGLAFGGRPTALWSLPNPLILNKSPSFGVRTNAFGFIISWATNVPVVVEACTNLAAPVWSPVATNTLMGGWSYFSDPDWTNNPSRLYRLRSP